MSKQNGYRSAGVTCYRNVDGGKGIKEVGMKEGITLYKNVDGGKGIKEVGNGNGYKRDK